MSIKDTWLIFNGYKNLQLVPFCSNMMCVKMAQMSKSFQEENEEEQEVNRNKWVCFLCNNDFYSRFWGSSVLTSSYLDLCLAQWIPPWLRHSGFQTQVNKWRRKNLWASEPWSNVYLVLIGPSANSNIVVGYLHCEMTTAFVFFPLLWLEDFDSCCIFGCFVFKNGLHAHNKK